MLTVLGWGVAGTVLLNLLGIVALVLSYMWQDWLQPKVEHRRARQRAFERLLAQPTLDMDSVYEPSNAGECWEW